MDKYFAGIGSRYTPTNVQNQMREISQFLTARDWTLTSGGAPGADDAFESTAKKKRIFLPWDGFNGRVADGKDYIVPEFDYAFARLYYNKSWKSLSEKGKKLMARNSCQVLLDRLDRPVDAVFCWTLDGREIGGTSQAMRIARAYTIPIINLAAIGFREWNIFEVLGVPEIKKMLPRTY